MSKIKNIIAREIIDSRGYPTIECDVILEDNIIGRASIPSGASKGIHEALEIRDNNKRFSGKGVLKAIENIHQIIKNELIGKNIFNQIEIDNILISLDGTKDKSNLGALKCVAFSLILSHTVFQSEN